MPAPFGSGPGYRRPVVVITSDGFTRTRIATVVCVLLTGNTRLAAAPGNVLLDQPLQAYQEIRSRT